VRGRAGLAGRWRFTAGSWGGVAGDGCAGQIVLYTGDFAIHPPGAGDSPGATGGARRLHAEPRDRTYRLRFAGDDVVVEGTYPDRDCPGRAFSGRWLLRRDGDALHGRLATSWLRTPTCRGMCTVDFPIRAMRVR